MIKKINVLLFLLFTLFLSNSLCAQTDAKQLFKKATDQLLTNNMEMDVEIDLTDDKGRVKSKGLTVLMGSFGETDKTMVNMQKPERAKGTIIIITNLPNETGIIEVFTPSNNKTRKLKATPENMALVGSEFNMAGISSFEADELSFKLIEKIELDGIKFNKIEVQGNKDKNSSKAEMLISDNSNRITQITVYDDKGEKKSFVTLSNYEAIPGMNKKYQPMQIKTEDFANKKVSDMRILKVAPRPNLKEGDFKLPETAN